MVEKFYTVRHSGAIRWLLLALAVSMWVTEYTLLYPIVAGTGVFLITVNVRLADKPAYRKMRTISTLIYFFHMYFLFLLKKGAQHGLYSFNRYEAWIIACVAITLFAILFDFLRKKPHFRWLNLFLGA